MRSLLHEVEGRSLSRYELGPRFGEDAIAIPASVTPNRTRAMTQVIFGIYASNAIKQRHWVGWCGPAPFWGRGPGHGGIGGQDYRGWVIATMGMPGPRLIRLVNPTLPCWPLWLGRPRKPRPLRRDVDALVERVASRPIVGRKPDPRQSGLFDARPSWIAPCMPVLVKTPPSGPEWAHEIKHDGYRAICLVDQGEVRIYTRRGHDWSARMPNIAAALAGLRLRSAVIDGEAIMTGEDGVSDFFALHAALARRSAPHATLMALDILHLDGEDLRGRALEDRRAILADVLRRPGASQLNHNWYAWRIRGRP